MTSSPSLYRDPNRALGAPEDDRATSTTDPWSVISLLKGIFAATSLKQVINVLDYIPVAQHAAIKAYTATTDISTYINLAFTAVDSAKGTLFFPAGLYPIASEVGKTSMKNVIIQGSGGANLSYNGTSGTVLKFTGTGSGNIVNIQDHRGVWVRDLQVAYTSNSFTGTFFNCATSFSTGCGSGFQNVQCYQITNSGHTASQCWYLSNNVDVTFFNCYASHANYGWLGLFEGLSGETNMIKLYNCTSIALKSAAVVNPVIGWSFYGCNFELSDTNGPAGFLSTASHDIVNCQLYSCVFADCSASGTWVSFASSTFNFAMYGGAILSLGGTVTGVLFNGAFNGCPVFHGVLFEGLTVGMNFVAATTGAIVTGCNFLTVTTPVSGKSNCDVGSLFRANNPGTVNDTQLVLKDGVTAPGAVSGSAIIYVDTSDGDLKVIFGDGTVKTIVVDT